MSSRAVTIVIALSAALLFSACGKKRSAVARANPPGRPRDSSINEPRTEPLPTELGIASWYGVPFHGRAAANGEIYDMEKLTAAHRTLPFGAWVRVTNLANNKTVAVRIIDRGPFIAGRIIDLSHAAAREIELIGPGVAQVRIDIISAPQVELAGSLYSVQAGIYRDRNRAEQLRETLENRYGAARLIFKDGKPAAWRLLVGVEDTIDGANLLARKIHTEVGSAFVVRLDELHSR